MTPRPALASTLPTLVLRVPATATVATLAGWSSQNTRRGPPRWPCASLGLPPADATGPPERAPGAAAVPGAAVPAPAAPGAPAVGAAAAAAVTTTVPVIPECH